MKARVALLAGLFSLCLVAVVAAQVTTVEGTVSTKTAGSLVVDTSTGPLTLMVDAQSSLPTNLAVGSRVKVEYDTLANGTYHASRVTVMGGTSAAEGTSTGAGTDTDSGRLPATASPLPLLALAGGLAMAGGVLVRRLRA